MGKAAAIALAVLAMSATPTSGVFAEPADAGITFEQHVRLIMERYCVNCHSGFFPKGRLRLDTLEHVLEGGKQGPAVVPGSPDKGWLINLVKPRGRYPSKMPPGPTQLSPEEIELLQSWIAQGAK